MRQSFASLALPALRWLDPERAHGLALKGLQAGLAGRERQADSRALAVTVLGRRFANPVGLAAGFDKDAVAVAPLLALGFGFVEAGTVTPRPQIGNPKPRLFRLTEDCAVINRMGMNGLGLEPFVGRLEKIAGRSGGLGANVGLNKDGADAERDYPALVAAVAPYADYVALNVSSPNTPGLRDLQDEARLRGILQAIQSAVPKRPPLLVKIAPDLSETGLQAIVECCVACGVDGLIVSNTTITRPAGMASAHKAESGGLSGRPLFELSNQVLARVSALSAGRLVLIGCGGVASGRDVLTKIRAGASLVQLYTAFAYGGPALIARLKMELMAALREDGFGHVSEAIGVDSVQS